MTLKIHLPTAGLVLLAVLAALASQRAAADPVAKPIRCDRYEILTREREDREELAEKRRQQMEAALTKLHQDGYVEILWADTYLTSYVAGEAHFIGFVCMARKT